MKKLLTGQTWYIYVVGYIFLEDEMGESTIDHTYGLLIARLAHIHRTRIALYLSQHHLHVGQEMLLQYLWNQDGLSQKEIGEFMGIQSATVTRMVIRMERSGFVERRTDPDDQRVSRVYLTDRTSFTSTLFGANLPQFVVVESASPIELASYLPRLASRLAQ